MYVRLKILRMPILEISTLVVVQLPRSFQCNLNSGSFFCQVILAIHLIVPKLWLIVLYPSSSPHRITARHHRTHHWSRHQIQLGTSYLRPQIVHHTWQATLTLYQYLRSAICLRQTALMTMLLELNSEDLKELGIVALGDRKKLEKVKNTKSSPPASSSSTRGTMASHKVRALNAYFRRFPSTPKRKILYLTP